MGGAGTAPKMKMSDALILVGATLLLGALFMHAWVSPLMLNGDDGPYEKQVNLMSGDRLVIEVTVENETTLRTVVRDTEDRIVEASNVVLAAGATERYTYNAENGGAYSVEIDTNGVDATLDAFSIERGFMIDMLPFPIGTVVLLYGLYLRQNSEEDAPKDHSATMDAILEPDPDNDV